MTARSIEAIANFASKITVRTCGLRSSQTITATSVSAIAFTSSDRLVRD